MATVPYSDPNSYAQWAEDLEAFAGLPTTAGETKLISAWEQSENPVNQVGSYTSHGGFNALNTSLKTGSSGLEPGSSFIPTFPDIGSALAATWSTLSQSNYAPEKQALEDQSGPELVSALGAPGHVWGSSPSLVSQILGEGPSTATSGGTGGGAATTSSFPGGALDPLNIPGEIAGGAASGVEGAILGVIKTITAPLTHFLEDSFLVVFGVILFVIGLVVIAKSVSSGNATTPTPPRDEEGGGDTDEGLEEDLGEEHEAEQRSRRVSEDTEADAAASEARSSRSSARSSSSSSSKGKTGPVPGGVGKIGTPQGGSGGVEAEAAEAALA